MPDLYLAMNHILSKPDFGNFIMGTLGQDNVPEYVSHQFLALISRRPNTIPPLKLDFVILMACSKLASTLTDAYQNPGVARYADVLHMMEKGINPACEDSLLAWYPPEAQIHLDRPTVVRDKFSIIIFWYLPSTIDLPIQNDMAAATAKIKGTPGCINLSPKWFLQGHPAPEFHPHVSATLKEFDGWSFSQAMYRLVALVTTALRVMHPKLYWSSLATKLALGLWAADKKLDEMGDHLREWASVFTTLTIMCNQCSLLHHDPLSHPQWFDIMTTFGNYGIASVKMPNLGIEIAYLAGCMVARSGQIIRHGLDMANSDRTAWVWYMKDDVHELMDIPRAGYSEYWSLTNAL
ncbi:hypothetical protein EDB19DRAFT_1830125 [Suillus lakei]|nr:hypothetical protein EDB19DRAFT_1830125 [Suillus lakei]